MDTTRVQYIPRSIRTVPVRFWDRIYDVRVSPSQAPYNVLKQSYGCTTVPVRLRAASKIPFQITHGHLVIGAEKT
jgi:hypothetical protein